MTWYKNPWLYAGLIAAVNMGGMVLSYQRVNATQSVSQDGKVYFFDPQGVEKIEGTLTCGDCGSVHNLSQRVTPPKKIVPFLISPRHPGTHEISLEITDGEGNIESIEALLKTQIEEVLPAKEPLAEVAMR